MAEESGDPIPEPPRSHEYWSQRIQEYIDSGKAAQHVQEGFHSSDSPFLNLQGFKDRESGRKRSEIGQSQFHQRAALGEASVTPSPVCEKSGHDWMASFERFTFFCARCGVTRTPQATFEEENEEDEVDRTCPWCGILCVTVEDLEGHEAECEP